MSDDVSAWLAAQVKTYAGREQPIYLKYADLMKAILREACNTAAPEASVESRVKSVSSFAEKAIRKRFKYNDPVRQFTDLCGARVITDTQEEVERVCQFIRKNFTIDLANSDDKAVLLGASQFGYRSVHFVVQLPDKALETEEARSIGGERKAEIQVRTELENAWARIAHDRMYKSPFEVPDSIQREMNRASALLEEVDRDFTLILDNLGRYSTSQSAFTTRDQMEQEIQILQIISENVQGWDERRDLAIRTAAAFKAFSVWEEVIRVLEPYAKDRNPEVLRELGAALCWKNRKDILSSGFRGGMLHLQQALEIDPDNAAIHACLGWALEEMGDEQIARTHYAKAHELKPHNPYYFMSHLEFQIAVERQLGSFYLLGPALMTAVETCRKHALAGIELPRAQFTEAKLLLLLNQPYSALAACARGIYTTVAAGSSVSEDTLRNELRSIKRLAPLKGTVRGQNWLERLLILAINTYADDKGSLPGTILSRRALSITQPVAIVAGGSELKIIPFEEAEYLRLAFEGFPGTIFCGAIRSGTGDVVGSIVESSPAPRSVGYHPQFLPAGIPLDNRHSTLVRTEGTDFSAEESLQMWSDLLAQGIKPMRVKVLGIGGGELTALEYQIAIALGAEVGVVTDSGGASDDLRKDDFWKMAKNLTVLPNDRMSIKIFVSPMEKLEVSWLDQAARVAHESYRQNDKHRTIDPAMVSWEELAAELQESERYHVSYSAEVLHFVSFAVRPIQEKEGMSVSFTKEEIELMAEMEHGRWTVERLRAGWKKGPRDASNKLTPYLVPWSELPEQVRQWDRDAVEAFPDVLKEAGLEIYRLPKPEAH